MLKWFFLSALLSSIPATAGSVTVYHDVRDWRAAVKQQYVVDDFESYDDEFPLQTSTVTNVGFDDLPRLGRPPAVYFGDSIGAGSVSIFRVLSNFDDEPFFYEEEIVGNFSSDTFAFGFFSNFVDIKVLLIDGTDFDFVLSSPPSGYVFFGLTSKIALQTFSVIGNFRQGDLLYTGTSIDDLHVSFTRPAQVAEPAALGLLATGSLLALARRRRSPPNARSVPGEQSA